MPSYRYYRDLPVVGLVRLHSIGVARHAVRMLGRLLVFALLFVAGDAGAAPVASLRDTYAALQSDLAHSAFGQPLVLASREQDGQVTGEIHAVVDHPFQQLRTDLASAADWCGVLYLHLNVKSCSAETQAGSSLLRVALGRKADTADGRTYELVFTFLLERNTRDYFHVVMQADEGPLGSRGYTLAFEAIPVEGNKAFLRLTYSVAYGVAGHLAMSSYLNTLGKAKVGFTVTGQRADGSAIYAGGIRGALERNTMRYYLAIQNHWAALTGIMMKQLQF